MSFILTEEKVLELFDNKDLQEIFACSNHLQLAKYLAQNYCQFTQNELKYIDLFWEPAFNKSWIYLADEIIINWMGYKGVDATRNFHRDMKSKYKENIDYQEVSKEHELVQFYHRDSNPGNPSKRGGALKKFYIVSGEALKKMLMRTGTKNGDEICDYFIKVESLCSLSMKLMFKYVENIKQQKEQQLEATKNKVLQLNDRLDNFTKFEKTGWIYIATSRLYSANNRYRFGYTLKLNNRMQNYQDGRLKQDEFYYVYTHHCACPNLLETIILQTLVHYKEHRCRDIFTLPLPILQKYVENTAKEFDKRISIANNISNELEQYTGQNVIAEPCPMKKIASSKVSVVQPKPKSFTVEPKRLEALESHLIKSWDINGYFLNMYDIYEYAQLPCQYTGKQRYNFEQRLIDCGLTLAINEADIGKDYVLSCLYVHQAKKSYIVPVLSLQGLCKFISCEKVAKVHRNKFEVFNKLIEKMKNPYQPNTSFVPFVQFDSQEYIQLEKHLIDHWDPDAYFISMYDMHIYAGIPIDYKKKTREAFRLKLTTHNLKLGTADDNTMSDYCIRNIKINGSKFKSEIPYFSIRGIYNYAKHASSYERVRLTVFNNLEAIINAETPILESDSEY